jgi:hypothetical protein
MMTRNEAIRHFGARSRSTLTAAQHLAAAPAAVRTGLHPEDLQWIARNPDITAVEAARRLAVRSRFDPQSV